MPIYEYRCEKCGHELEVMQKLSDPAPEKCPQCGEPHKMEKLMSRSAFHLKGGGWGSDLYGSSKKDPVASGAATTTPADASKGATSSTGPSTPGASTATPAAAAGTSTTTSAKASAPAAPAASSGTPGSGKTS